MSRRAKIEPVKIAFLVGLVVAAISIPAKADGGDTCGTATVITCLPFNDTGSTVGDGDDYNDDCGFGSGSNAGDVVYSYTPSANETITAELCNSSYDTYIYMFTTNCTGSTTACNDDACGTGSLRSRVSSVSLTSGTTYYFVIDGFSTNEGAFEIDITTNSSGDILSDHDNGQETDAFTQSGSETDAELFGFEIEPAGSLTVTQIVFRLTDIIGLVDGDWSGLEIVEDTNGDGTIGGGETTTVGGSGTVSTSGGTITFSTSFGVSSDTNYILRGDFSSLSTGDKVNIALSAADVSTAGCIGGSTESVTHFERCNYVERFETFTASSADSWLTQSLSGSPYDVPANAVVEIAVRNDSCTAERWGGVRAVGSSLDRRFQLHEAEEGTDCNEGQYGQDFVVMHVQTNASSQIEYYSDVTTNVDFVLLGYWECGTYTEAFDTFTAGASASWQDEDLCTYGVGAGYVAEIVMTNDDTANENNAGVRSNGSSLSRLVDLHEAEGGGVDTATMFVQADTTDQATVEVYAEIDGDVDFYLVGYWSEAPLAYTELYADPGSPVSDDSWEDDDLTAQGVANNAVVEFALANEFTIDENDMGVRTNGSSLDRFLQLQEAESGGDDLARMHVFADSTGTIEFFMDDVSDAHTFRILGYWDTCDTSVEYNVSDLGAITGANSSLGWAINATEKIAGFEEDSNGDPDAWFLDCGSFSSLGTLGGSDAEASGINDSNMVCGWAENGSGDRRAFTWTSGGGMVDLGTVGGRTDTIGTAVNNSSEVVGEAVDFGMPPNNRIAFIYLPVAAYTLSSGMTSLGTLGGDQSVARDINDSGRVVGGAQNSDGNVRPFRWNNGTMTDLGTLGGDIAQIDHRAECVNASGNIAGRSYTAGGDAHAFYWNGSSMSDLGTLTGGSDSWAFGMNDSNVVVGTSEVTGGNFRAFVWDSTNGMRNLNDLLPSGHGWTLIRATGINNDGFIVGFGTNGSAQERAFLLTPTCTAGGGGATAAILLDGEGFTDNDGDFTETILDSKGNPLAEVEITANEVGVPIILELAEADLVSSEFDEAGATFDGFDQGLGFSRTLTVEPKLLTDGSTLLVSMTFTAAEIEELGVDPEDLGVHVRDSDGSDHSSWVPAGTNLGEMRPSHVIGESGFMRHDDDSIDYWAVRDSKGVFGVGKLRVGTQEPDDADDPDAGQNPPMPGFCGFGMMPSLVIGLFMLNGMKRFIRRRQNRNHHCNNQHLACNSRQCPNR